MTVALVRHPAPIQQLCICLFSPPQAWSTISRRPPTDVFDMVPFSSGSPMARKPAINGSSPPPPSFSPPPPPPHVFLKERGDYSAALCSFLHYVVMKLVDKLLYWYLCNCIQVVQLTIAHIQYADSTPVFPPLCCVFSLAPSSFHLSPPTGTDILGAEPFDPFRCNTSFPPDVQSKLDEMQVCTFNCRNSSVSRASLCNAHIYLKGHITYNAKVHRHYVLSHWCK